MTERYRCEECDEISNADEIDVVVDPRREDNSWSVCPHCRAADHFARVCADPDCTKFATIGTPTPDGYKWLCYEHGSPFLKS